jgi:hypothetical protein
MKKKFIFFNQKFSKKRGLESPIKFGAYTDRNKSVEQLQLLQEAENYFTTKNYFPAIEHFFMFLKDPKKENVKFDVQNNILNFTIHQGSKLIKGKVDNDVFFAQAEVIKVNNYDENLLDELLKLNYQLKFCKFSLENQTITLILSLRTSQLESVSLYYALREIAITADKYDDLLKNKYPNVEPVNVAHIKPLDEKEYEIKKKYLNLWIKQTLASIKKYDVIKFYTARSFLLLNLTFRIFYLLSPEGLLLEIIKEIYDIFYQNNTLSDLERNAKIIGIYEKILLWNENQYKDSFYSVMQTFPEVPPSNPETVRNFAKNEIEKIHWYEANNHKDIALSILEYIVGFATYSYGNIPVLDELFFIFRQVMHKDFFIELGLKQIPYDRNKISYYLVNQRITSINAIAKNSYHKFFFNTKHLNLDNTYEFAKSFIYELINQNFSETQETVTHQKAEQNQEL